MAGSPYAAAVEAAVVAAFEPHRDPARAAAMAAYMRDQFPFLGIATPARDALSRTVMAGLEAATARGLTAAARACWRLPEREYQYFAIRLLRWELPVLTAGSVDALEWLITTKSWWDTVDELAVNVVGPLVTRYSSMRRTMDSWIASKDLWLARTAILHQVRYQADTDADLLFRYCLLRSGETDFFVRKAIGWALRDYSRTDPTAVRRFVDTNAARLSGLSRREALRLLGR